MALINSEQSFVDTNFSALSVTPCSPNIGAEIGLLDLTKPLSNIEVKELRDAFIKYQVIFFRDQKISFEDHIRLAEYFGVLGSHVGKSTISKTTEDPRVRKFHYDENTPRVSGDVFHTDQSCAAVPPLGSILYNHTLPPNGGGDTLFSSMYAAYDALSVRMKVYLQGLTAYHDGVPTFGAGTPNANHPVIVKHPESGKKLIYVNEVFTMKINELSEHESKAILEYLCAHCARPEWTTRFRWKPHSIAFWDNRCTQHMAISDYLPSVRSGYRVQLDGKSPPVAA
ncbi:MAG: Alpha-ketoglutarate-dependent taurine dioxygenase [Alphaproteobacteria bacterium MarineAlpha11_Bin1]|nr:MAG: Alpha-ketoglutarate-dependent taurine dioxygenase [Alphaproteobacteria bacterium MarineAlpha11_Bin1]|tara:strand:+ start:1934 stop:2782 length:849 start_codon:yes stop_codon:yes gene_type:complete